MILAKVPERECVQVPAMCRVAERAEVCIVRRFYAHTAPWANQPVKLLHGSDHIRQVLDDMNRSQLGKRVVGKWIRNVVQIAKHIGMAVRIPVDADCPGPLVDPATDIERSRFTHVNILPKLYNDGRKIASMSTDAPNHRQSERRASAARNPVVR